MDYSDVFISYRRVDSDFVKKLDKALKDGGREVWVDWEDIPPGSTDFTQDIQKGIEGADAFIAVLSPDYLDSPYCMGELDYAVRHHKRLVPVVLHKFEGSPVPPSISHINWVYFTEHAGQSNEFEEALKNLMGALDTDHAYVRNHTRLLTRAQEWADNNQDKSFLLNGIEIKEAEGWLAQSAQKEPKPSRLHSEYIFASVAAERNQQRRLLFVAGVAIMAMMVLAIFAVWQAVNAENRRQDADTQRARAVQSEATAVWAQGVAERNAVVSHSLSLASAAQLANTTDHPLALTLAIAAVQMDEPPPLSQRVLGTIAHLPGAVSRFDGHVGEVRGVAFHPDGVRAISGGIDGAPVLWDTITGEQLRRYEGHDERVWDVKFSPDGTQFVSAAADNTLILWDVETGDILQRFEGHEGWVWSTAFSPDGKTLVSGGNDNLVMIWDAETGELLHRLEDHTGLVRAVAFHPDDDKVISGSWDGTMILWDTETGELLRQYDAGDTGIRAVAFTPDGSQVLAGLRDGDVKLWDTESGDVLRQYSSGVVGSLDISQDGNTALLGSRDGTIVLLDLATGRQNYTFTGHTGGVWSVDFSPDETHIISGSSDETVMIWDVQPGGRELLDTLPDSWFRVSYAEQASYGLLSDATDDGERITLRDFGSDEDILSFDIVVEDAEKDRRSSSAIRPDGAQVAWGRLDGEITLVNPDDAETRQFSASDEAVVSLIYSPDGTQLVSASVDGALYLWDVDTGAQIHAFEGHQTAVITLAFSDDGTRLLTGATNGQVILWDVETGDIIQRFEGYDEQINIVAISPGGQTILTGTSSRDSLIFMWDVETGKIIQTYKGHKGGLTDLTYNPDGSMVLSSATSDNIVILWDAATGEQIRTFAGHTSAVAELRFSDDGTHFVSIGQDDLVIAWQVDSLEQMVNWAKDHRYLRELTCDERELYRVEPYCVEELPGDDLASDS